MSQSVASHPLPPTASHRLMASPIGSGRTTPVESPDDSPWVYGRRSGMSYSTPIRRMAGSPFPNGSAAQRRSAGNKPKSRLIPPSPVQMDAPAKEEEVVATLLQFSKGPSDTHLEAPVARVQRTDSNHSFPSDASGDDTHSSSDNTVKKGRRKDRQAGCHEALCPFSWYRLPHVDPRFQLRQHNQNVLKCQCKGILTPRSAAALSRQPPPPLLLGAQKTSLSSVTATTNTRNSTATTNTRTSTATTTSPPSSTNNTTTMLLRLISGHPGMIARVAPHTPAGLPPHAPAGLPAGHGVVTEWALPSALVMPELKGGKSAFGRPVVCTCRASCKMKSRKASRCRCACHGPAEPVNLRKPKKTKSKKGRGRKRARLVAVASSTTAAAAPPPPKRRYVRKAPAPVDIWYAQEVRHFGKLGCAVNVSRHSVAEKVPLTPSPPTAPWRSTALAAFV